MTFYQVVNVSPKQFSAFLAYLCFISISANFFQCGSDLDNDEHCLSRVNSHYWSFVWCIHIPLSAIFFNIFSDVVISVVCYSFCSLEEFSVIAVSMMFILLCQYCAEQLGSFYTCNVLGAFVWHFIGLLTDL